MTGPPTAFVEKWNRGISTTRRIGGIWATASVLEQIVGDAAHLDGTGQWRDGGDGNP